MWRILAKYNEANANKEKELDLRKCNYNDKLKLCKRNLIRNKIEQDLLYRMRDDYLRRINYKDYIDSSDEIKQSYEEIYTKIFDIQKDQKQLKKEYEDYLNDL